jgi:hypothetical protein
VAEQRLRAKLREKSPSEPWVEAQFIEITEFDERGDAIVRQIHNPRLFPPGGDQTAMVRCRVCGIFTPPNAMEDGVCLDHREGDDWGPSPSAQAIFALRYWNLRIDKAELLPESIAELQLEMRKR